MARYRPFAGIGSRKTPVAILVMMHQISFVLSMLGYTMRSGGADKADTAFGLGAKAAISLGGAYPEIYLPWPKFNKNDSAFTRPPPEAYEIAAIHHPGWAYIEKDSVKALMARNAQQIQGQYLETHSQFVICWTPDGCLDGMSRSRATGGTGQAITHAASLGIPVFNLQRPEHLERFNKFLLAHPHLLAQLPSNEDLFSLYA